jgi:hypothetical protein
MKIINPLMVHPKMILVYKGSNQIIHNSANKMTSQNAYLERNLKINGNEVLGECIVFKILDVTLVMVMYGCKVYEVIKIDGEKVYIHLPNSYFYFHETPDDKNIIIHGLLIYQKQYSEKCIFDERFKFQIKFIKDSIITKMLEKSNRFFEEQLEM